MKNEKGRDGSNRLGLKPAPARAEIIHNPAKEIKDDECSK